MNSKLVKFSLAGAVAAALVAATVVLLTGPVHGSAWYRSVSRIGGFCGPVASLTSRVVRDACEANPELRNSSITETEAASVLRRWAASWIDISTDGKFLIPEESWKWSLDTLYAKFLNHETGTYCGSTAVTLMKLYEAFGFEAWTYNFGHPDNGLGHVVTLVRADSRLLVQDAFFNSTVRRKDGSPIDVHDILRAARDRQIERTVDIVTEQPVTKIALFGLPRVPTDPSTLDDWMGGNIGIVTDCTLVRPGVVKCLAKNVEGSHVRNWERWGELVALLRQHGLPAHPLYWMLMPLATTSAQDGYVPINDPRDIPAKKLLDSLLTAMAKT